MRKVLLYIICASVLECKSFSFHQSFEDTPGVEEEKCKY